MLLKCHVGFIKRKSPVGIKMKKGSLIMVLPCPVTYIIRNVLYLLPAFIARCTANSPSHLFSASGVGFPWRKLSDYSVTKIMLISQHSFCDPLWRLRLENIQKGQVRSAI